MSSKAEGIGRRIAIGAGWMVALRWTDRLIGAVSIAILARLLLPEDFGLLGYAMLVIGLLDLLSTTSTESALIRERDADAGFYDAAWTMNVIRGAVIGAAILALARPAATYFRTPELEAVMFALAALPLMQGMVNVGLVEFGKQLRFDVEFKWVLLARILATIATIGMAFAWRTYWALIVGTLLRALLQIALGYWLHPFRAKWNFVRIPEIFRFSRWMMMQHLAAGLNSKVPVLIIGREWDSSVVGFFNMGREIANLANSEIRAPVRRALFAGLAQLATTPARLKPALVEATGMFALLTLPIPLGIALVAHDLVPLFLGPQWEPMVGLLQILCVASAAFAIATNSHLVFVVQNRAYLTAASEGMRLVVVVLAILVVGTSNGVEVIAYAIAVANAVNVVGDYVLSSRLLGIPIGRFGKAVWRPVVGSAAMCGAVILAGYGFAEPSDLTAHAIALVRSVAIGVATYVGVVLALWFAAGRPEGAERRLLSVIAAYRRRAA